MPSPLKQILLVDDDADDIELLQSAIFETFPDLKVTIAIDGNDLLCKLHSIPKPDIIVLDINLPYKSGKECLKEIRKNVDFNNVPIVMYSTSNQIAEKSFCLSNGANEYYVKPNCYSGIQNIVRDLCDGHLFVHS